MTPSPALRDQTRYTYADYLTWPDDERWELIDGIPYSMSPAPGRLHQRIFGELFGEFRNYLKNKSCEVYAAPFDVRLPNSADDDDSTVTVVQPDILVVCDVTKLDDRGCKGAPDLVVEISSPSTGKTDLTVKYDLYERHGVKEYWIVHPAEMTLLVYKLDLSGRYGAADRYAGDDKVPVPLLGELVIDLGEVFAE